MKKFRFLFILGIGLIFLFSGCTKNDVENQLNETEFFLDPETPYLTQDGFLKSCDLISVEEWQTLFEEAPLFIEEVNGGCLIKNQWETRSIFIGLYSPNQAYQTMRWFTESLAAESKDPEFLFQLRELLGAQDDQDIRSLIDQRIDLYEALLYRSERIFVIGDFAIWFSYHESSTNILEILEGDVYIRINLAGFYPVDARTLALEIGNKLIDRKPTSFDNLFNVNIIPNLAEESPPVFDSGSPELATITANPEEIFFGSFCGAELAEIEVVIDNSLLVNNVLLVYRLTSQAETNQNWTTVFMAPNENSGWTKSLNAETDFSAYTLTDDAVVEVTIGVLYGVDQVYNSPIYQILQVNQCGEETPAATTPLP